MEPISSLQLAHVLVPCDFSTQSDEVLRYGSDFAKRYNAQLTLLHVYEPPTYAIPPDATMMASPEILAQQIEEVMETLNQMKQRALAFGVKEVHVKVAQGIPAMEIIQESLERTYQLIVMGTHGRTGLKHALIGSVAEKVVRKAACPVLTIRIQSPSN